MPLSHMLKGISGEFEIVRVLGASGVGTYIITAPAFEFWQLWHGSPFDLVAFCAAFPAGLGVAIGAVSGAAALKDRNAAQSQVTLASAGTPQP